MPEDEYRSLRETAYLMTSPANAVRLRASVAEVEAGKATERQLACAPE